MAAKCAKGHRMEYLDPEIEGCVICAMEEGRAPGRRDYDGTPLRDDEHASACLTAIWGPLEKCDCGAKPA